MSIREEKEIREKIRELEKPRLEDIIDFRKNLMTAGKINALRWVLFEKEEYV